MPTVGWILETAEERFWDGQPRQILGPARLLVFICPQCGKELPSVTALRDHISLDHPLALPSLHVTGNSLLRESVLRSPVAEDEIEVFQCSRCRVRVDGGYWQELTIPEFRARFSQARNSTWNIQLLHERLADGVHVGEEYSVRFRIPDPATLSAVDEHFIRTLVRDELSHADLDRFAAGLPQDAPAREYGSALGNYGLGLLLKERQNSSHAPVEFAEFVAKMRSALETLHLINRPVPLAVVSSIRFNLNDFHNTGTGTPTELEAALRFFRRIAKLIATARGARLGAHRLKGASIYHICPIDRVSFRLLSISAGMLNGEGPSPADLSGLLRFVQERTPISEQDLAKVHVICAEGYSLLGLTNEARRHLHAIQFDSTFKQWAHRRLEEMPTYGE